jgi:hypothetical protein
MNIVAKRKKGTSPNQAHETRRAGRADGVPRSVVAVTAS